MRKCGRENKKRWLTQLYGVGKEIKKKILSTLNFLTTPKECLYFSLCLILSRKYTFFGPYFDKKRDEREKK